jgi:hypothetical protein
MIRLNGSLFADPGSTVCIMASNVGPGFSVTAQSGDPAVKLKIAIDNTTHTATICFVAPASGQGVALYAIDANTPRGATHAVVSR